VRLLSTEAFSNRCFSVTQVVKALLQGGMKLKTPAGLHLEKMDKYLNKRKEDNGVKKSLYAGDHIGDSCSHVSSQSGIGPRSANG
jgi:hypothetical protein